MAGHKRKPSAPIKSTQKAEKKRVSQHSALNAWPRRPSAEHSNGHDPATISKFHSHSQRNSQEENHRTKLEPVEEDTELRFPTALIDKDTGPMVPRPAPGSLPSLASLPNAQRDAAASAGTNDTGPGPTHQPRRSLRHVFTVSEESPILPHIGSFPRRNSVGRTFAVPETPLGSPKSLSQEQLSLSQDSEPPTYAPDVPDLKLPGAYIDDESYETKLPSLSRYRAASQASVEDTTPRSSQQERRASVPPSSQPRGRTGHAADSLINVDTSFSDIVVLRDVESFSYNQPAQEMLCTPATRQDTARIRTLAMSLLRYDESYNVYSMLNHRLQRMIYAQIDKVNAEEEPDPYECAAKMRDFIVQNRDMRIETGESKWLVEHEAEWAEWLADATECGVLHFKVKGCKCRPDYKAPKDDNGEEIDVQPKRNTGSDDKEDYVPDLQKLFD